MQHPIHLHGQRFLVLAVNGVPNENLVWKDTVLVPAGATVDILLDLSNPGRWMATLPHRRASVGGDDDGVHRGVATSVVHDDNVSQEPLMRPRCFRAGLLLPITSPARCAAQRPDSLAEDVRKYVVAATPASWRSRTCSLIDGTGARRSLTRRS